MLKHLLVNTNFCYNKQRNKKEGKCVPGLLGQINENSSNFKCDKPQV